MLSTKDSLLIFAYITLTIYRGLGLLHRRAAGVPVLLYLYLTGSPQPFSQRRRVCVCVCGKGCHASPPLMTISPPPPSPLIVLLLLLHSNKNIYQTYLPLVSFIFLRIEKIIQLVSYCIYESVVKSIKNMLRFFQSRIRE